ncbi:MAG: hypothetical protein ABEL76_08480 [Bradymonadaceae bacterium]
MTTPEHHARAFIALLLTAVVSACGSADGQSSSAWVQIDSPDDSSAVTTAPVDIRGQAGGAETVVVGGEETEVVGGKWEVTVDLEDGHHRLVARAGSARDTVSFTVDTEPPSLEIDQPDRAAIVASGGGDGGNRVVVAGRASDSETSLRAVAVDGQVVEVDDEGRFRRRIGLDTGLNRIEISAIDGAGNETTALRGLLHGPIEDPTQRVSPGFDLSLNSGALRTGEKLIEAWMSPARLTRLARARAGIDRFDVDKVEYQTADVSLMPGEGRLRATVDFRSLVVHGTLSVASADVPIRITLDRASVRADLSVDAGENGKLDISLVSREATVRKRHFHLAVDQEKGTKEIDRASVRRIGATLVERLVAEAIGEGFVDDFYDPSILKRRIEFLGRRFEFRLVPTAIHLRRDGIFVETDIEMSGRRASDVRSVPGALTRSLGPADWQPMDRDAVFRTTQRTLDRVLHGLWRAGMFHHTLTSEDFQGIDLPIELDVGALATALDPKISSLAPDDTPIGIRLRPQLPPVAGLRENDDGPGVRTRVGELLVDLMLSPSKDPTRIASLALFVRVSVAPAIEDSKLSLTFDATTRADLAAEPQIDLADREIESLVEGIANGVPRLVERSLTLSGAGALPWIRVDDARFDVQGANRDRALLGVDLDADTNAVGE